MTRPLSILLSTCLWPEIWLLMKMSWPALEPLVTELRLFDLSSLCSGVLSCLLSHKAHCSGFWEHMES